MPLVLDGISVALTEDGVIVYSVLAMLSVEYFVPAHCVGDRWKCEAENKLIVVMGRRQRMALRKSPAARMTPK